MLMFGELPVAQTPPVTSVSFSVMQTLLKVMLLELDEVRLMRSVTVELFAVKLMVPLLLESLAR